VVASRSAEQGPSRLELKLPPVMLGAIAARSCGPLHRGACFRCKLSGELCVLGESGPDGCSYVSGWRDLVQMGEDHGQPDEAGCWVVSVVSGIYRYTGIPCTLVFLLILLGWAAFLSKGLAVIVLPAFVLYMIRFQIFPEERVLTAIFADEYTEYLARVRGWL
jgi:hypothetical protein